jgi:hypothetical protein
VLKRFLSAPEGLQVYSLDLLFGHLKFFLLAQLGILGVVLAAVGRLPRRFVIGLFVVFTALDLMAFNFRFDNITAPFFHRYAFYNKEFFYPEINPQARQKMDLVNYRIGSLNKVGLNANKNLVFSLPSYTGTLGYLSKRFSKFVSSFGYPKDAILIYPEDEGLINPRFLDLSAVRYAFDENGNVLERPESLSRLNLFYSYEVVEDEDLQLKLLANTSFDPQRDVVLSAGPPTGAFPKSPRKSERLSISQYTSDKIKAHIYADDPAIVLFSESYDKGWKAYVDNKNVPLITANYNFMACAVGPGQHEVLFRYEPQNFYLALKLSLAGLFIMLIVFFCFIKDYLRLFFYSK